MRKNQIESKLDKEICHTAKNQAIEIDFVERLSNNEELDIGLRDDDNLNIANI